MRERLRGLIEEIQGRWNKLERSQRFRLIATVVALITTLGITIYFTTRPKMVILADGLDYTAISDMHTALDEAGIRNTITRSGKGIQVLEKEYNIAKITLADQDIPSSGTFTYQDALSFSGMGTTESIKKQNFRRVKESEMGQALGMFSGVDSAKVFLEVPEENNYFFDSGENASASALLKTSKQLDKSEAAAIARFMSRSVKGLTLDNIEILDQNGTLYSGTAGNTDSVGTAYDIEQQRKQEIELKIKSYLSPYFDEIKIVSNIVVDSDKTSSTTKTVTNPVEDSTSGYIDSEIISRQTVTNAATDGEPGLGANDQVAPNYEMQNGTGSSASINDRETKYLYDEQLTETEKGSGGIKTADSGISIMAYRYAFHNQAYMEQHSQLPEGQTWEDFKAATLPSLFDVEQDIIEDLKIGTGISNLIVRGTVAPVFVDKEVKPVDVTEIVMFAILALLILLLAFGLIRRTRTEEVTEIEPELSVEDLLVSTQLDEQKEAEAEKLKDIDFNQDSESKRQIEKFVNEKPESVAQLLRNWLNDEWE